MSVWTEIKAVLNTPPEDWAVFAEVFERFGMPGTVQTDHPPTISAYVPPGEAVEVEALKAALLERGAASIEQAEVPETDWAEAWKEFFKPQRIGQRFVIVPSWETYETQPEDIVLNLDPGQAFGTGEHPTTRLCLRLLEKRNVAGTRIADVGCGSGILGIAAAKLGAEVVDAVDIDPLSVEVTLENAARNGVTIDAHTGEGFDPLGGREPYDLVFSNIISAALIGVAPTAARFVKSGGEWIISGVIESNWPDVQEAIERAGFIYVEHDQEGDWIAACFRK